jgi:hypothetical protein
MRKLQLKLTITQVSQFFINSECVYLAKILIHNSKFKEAHLYLDKGIQCDNLNCELLIAKITLLFEEKNLIEAKSLIDRSLTLLKSIKNKKKK